MIFLDITPTVLIFLLLAFIGIIAIPFVYLITLQNTIKEIDVRNRFIQPYEVWLIFIPIIGIFLHLGHISRLTNSLKKDFNFKKIKYDNDSQFGEGLGFAFCLMSILNFFFSSYLYYKLNRISKQEYPSCGTCTETENLELNISLFFFGIISLISLICWIIYWVKIANCKHLLLVYNNNNPQSLKKESDSTKLYEKNSIYTKKCNNCDTTALAEDKYCMKCGNTSFQSNIDALRKEIDEKKEILKERFENKKCPNCNKIIYSNDLICNSCGVLNENPKVVEEKTEISKELIEDHKSVIETFFIKNNISTKDKTYGLVIIAILVGFLIFNFVPFNNHSKAEEAPPEEPVQIVDTITSTNSNEDNTNSQLVNTDTISDNSSEIENFSEKNDETTSNNNNNALNDNPNLIIGQNYNGGTIIYLDDSKKHGLLCSEMIITDMVNTFEISQSQSKRYSVDNSGNWRLPSKSDFNYINSIIDLRGETFWTSTSGYVYESFNKTVSYSRNNWQSSALIFVKDF